MPRAAWSAVVHTAVRSAHRASRPQELVTARRHMATTPRSHLFTLLATAPLPSARCSPHRWMVHGACATSTLLARTMQCRSKYVLSTICFVEKYSYLCRCRPFRGMQPHVACRLQLKNGSLLMGGTCGANTATHLPVRVAISDITPSVVQS